MEKQLLFEDLSNLYSTPATKDDDILDYIPTQFIAEYAKSLGYDGIAFSSSLTPEYTPEMHRYNIVIFNYEKCKPVKSNVFEVFETYFTVKNKDSDAESISVALAIVLITYIIGMMGNIMDHLAFLCFISPVHAILPLGTLLYGFNILGLAVCALLIVLCLLLASIRYKKKDFLV